MKPIQLKLSGLQSYREEQAIDFSQLCEAGVFGIFGPTGSGKSSILDAMTLALYGKVERAANGTQGIMNQAEDQLAVSFTFRLESGQEQETYRVERRFKRGNDISVNNTVSRLLDISTGREEVVLADKQSEVNQQIHELLGLEMHDFTRAVVLPQGKFAEFLSLKGKERREMLQRLFHLEKYGDQLQQRLLQKVKQTDIEHKELAAEQQGLGDASQEQLRQAETDYEAAAQEALHTKRQAGIVEQQFQEKQQWVGWQQEMKVKSEQLSRLEEKKAEIKQMEQSVSRAEQAEKLQPYLERLLTSRKEKEQSEQFEKQARLETQQRQTRFELQERLYSDAQQQLQQHEGPLLVQLEQIKQAMQLEQQVKALQPEEQLLLKQSNELEERQRKILQTQDKEAATLEKAKQKQKSLKEELKHAEVTQQERKRIQQLLQDKQHLELLDKEHQDKQYRYKSKAKELQQLQEKADRLKEQQEQYKAQALPAVEQMLHTLAEQEQIQVKLIQLQNEAEHSVRTIQDELNAHEQQQIAFSWAGKLKAGEHCPVCGALEHPRPATPPDHQAQAKITDWHEKIDKLVGVQQEAATVLTELRQVAWQTRQQLEQSLLFDNEAAAAKEESSLQAEKDSSLLLTASELEQLLQESSEMAKTWSEHAPQQMRQLYKLQADFELGEKALQSACTEMALLQKLTDELDAEAKAAAAASEKANRQWIQSNPEQEPDMIEKLAKQLEEKEDQEQQLRERIEKSVGFIEELDQQLRQRERQLAQLEKDLLQHTSDLNALRRQLAEKQDQCKTLVGDAKADSRYQQVTQQLEQLRQQEKAAKSEWETIRTQLQQAENHQSKAEERNANAALQFKHAEQTWQEQLQTAIFDTEEQVLQAVVSADRIAEMKEQLRAYEQQTGQLKHELGVLQEKLQGRSVSDQEWRQLQQELAMWKQKYDESLEKKAKLQRDFEDMQRKHKRWQELEQQRLQKQESLERLQQLQRVLRGNAFVEFIAEEQLMQVSQMASERLGQLTRQRYAIEVDSSGGFIIRDDANGGVKRPVSTLSGGETFLTSLALALALSAQIQLRGKYPLQFFFLDEGFGTLDPDLLEGVVSALEKLHLDQLSVGVISHVPELRARLPRKLIVQPAEPSGRGSTVKVELM